MPHHTKPDITRPLVVSSLIVLAVAGAAAGLASRAPAPGEVARVKAEPVGGKIVTLPPGEDSAMAGPAQKAKAVVDERTLRRRLAHAGEFERRYRARDLPVEARVTGDRLDVFTFRWTLEPNPGQQRRMKHAEPLWRELRALGFRRVEMMNHRATKTLWYKDL